MRPVSEIFSKLSNPAKVVITMHQKPDGDAMGASLGLYHFLVKLGHQVTVVSPTNWAAWINWMPGSNTVINFEKNQEKIAEVLNQTGYLFCLDFNIFHRTKNLAPLLEAAQCTKILIDHHEQPDAASFHYGISNSDKSSTCEMVYDFIQESGYDHLIDETIAQCIYTGVVTDTGSFRFASTTASVHQMVARLIETGFDHAQVHSNIYDNYLENRLRFIGHALSNRMEFFYEYNAALIAITKQDLLRFDIKTGDTEGIVNFPQTVQGIKLVGLVIDRDEERKWSFRSKGDFDCNSFARQYFNGGGHFNASGGNTKDSLDETVKKFKLAMKENEHLLA